MDGLKLKDNNLTFIGAYVHDENNPVVGKCMYALSSKMLSIFQDSSEKPTAIEKLTDLKFENPNQYISVLNFICDKKNYSFHVGVFPEESYPIDNITDSILASFTITDNKAVVEKIQKDRHAVIKYMADIIQKSLKN